MGVAFYVLLGAAFTVLTAVSIGKLMLRRWAPGLFDEEEWPLSFVIGSGALSLFVFLLFTSHLAYKGVFIAAGVLAIGCAIRLGAYRSTKRRFQPLPATLKWIGVAGFAAFTTLYFFNAMAPEASPDGSSYHLGLMARYLRARSFVDTPYNMYAQLSEGIEMLFAFAFSIGRHSAAALVHFSFLVTLSALLLAYGRRIGQPAAGMAAALIFYTSPVVGMDGTSAYIDVAVACILFAIFYLTQLWDERRSTSLLVLLGFAAGFAYAAKYTAFLAVPYAVGYVAWRSRKWKPAAVVALASLVLITPWVAKNLMVTGNPVAPLMNRWFPNHYVHVAFEREWSRQLRNYSVKSFTEVPWELTVKGEQLSGHIGVMFLLIPLSLLSLRSRTGRRLFIPALLYTAPYFGNIGARFLIPPLPFWALLISLGLSAWPVAQTALAAMACVLCWPGIMRQYSGKYLWALESSIPFKAALRLEPEDQYLADKHPEYNITRVVDLQTPPGARIFTFHGRMDSYTTRELAVGFQSARGETLSEVFTGAFSPDLQPRLRQSVAFKSQAIRRLRLVETTDARQPAEEWVVNEVRLLADGKEVPRSAEWRITARRNPWDIRLAFDNSPVTRWRSWQPLKAGDFIEIDLLHPTTLDEVAVETHVSQHLVGLRVEVEDEHGGWRIAGSEKKESELPGRGFQGKAAMAELRAAGFDYLLVQPDDWGGPEVAEDPAAWGLTPVGRSGLVVLYRIDVEGPLLEEK